MAEINIKQEIQLPDDATGRPLSGVVTPVVDGSGNITGWEPGIAVSLIANTLNVNVIPGDTIAVTNFNELEGLTVNIGNQLVPQAYDYYTLVYSTPSLTTLTSIVYKSGGASGTTVATVTYGYTGNTLTSVTKT